MRLTTSVLWILIFLVFNTMAWSFSNLLLSGARVGLSASGVIDLGIQRAMAECQSQFKWDRWNCPRSSFTFSKIERPPGTKNPALFSPHAIFAVMTGYGVTRNAFSATFDRFDWRTQRRNLSSHSDNRHAVAGRSSLIVHRKDDRFSNQHNGPRLHSSNNRAISGHTRCILLQLVRKTMRRVCKCHGTSGSCASVTCWMQLADIGEVGRRLRQAYEGARRVEFN
ncbi:unnamed protein product, partial [Ixodes hexagonus]